VAPRDRPFIWALMVGMIPFEAQQDDFPAIIRNLTDQYRLLKSRSSPPPSGNLSRDLQQLYDERKHRVEKDVVRTDSASKFFTSSSSTTVASAEDANDTNHRDHGSQLAIDASIKACPRWRELRDILLTYSMYRLDIGYVQGMSDIASAIHQMVCTSDNSLLQSDEDLESWSFWLFVNYMHPFHDQGPHLFQELHYAKVPIVNNFHSDQSGLRCRLILVLYLLRIVEAKFFAALSEMDRIAGSDSSNGATSLFWLFRSLLLNFKRDVNDSNGDLFRLWDGILAGMFSYSLYS
jgi:TBC1 domain family member 15